MGEIQKRLLALWEEEPQKNLAQVCEAVGVSTSTVHRWREQDPSFDERFRKAQLAADRARLSSLEESVYEQVGEKEASTGLTIFTLVNLSNRIARATGDAPRWEHRQQLEVEAQVRNRHEEEILFEVLMQAREDLDRMERESIPSPWESSEEEPRSSPSPWQEEANPPPENGDGR